MVIDFSATLQSKLCDPLEVTDIEVLIADTGHHIQQIHHAIQPGSGGHLPSNLAKDAERHGGNLWNLCVRLKRGKDATKPGQNTKLVAKARLFALNMLELGRSAGRAKKDDTSEAVDLMNLALELAKFCMAVSDLDSTRLALQKAAELMERLKAISVESLGSIGQNKGMKLDAEYLAMRTAMSWKEDRLDVAEHMFGKIDHLRPALDASSAEIIADTFHRIGYDLSSKGDYGMAVKWLKRAYDIICRQALDKLSVRGLELRLAIFQGLVRGLLDTDSQECFQEADKLIEYIESEIGDKPLVLHLRLELLQKAPEVVFDVEAYSGVLHRMVRSFDYSDMTFIFLLHHLKNLRERNHRLARGLLDELLLRHVIASKNSEWMGKTIVRRIWMNTTRDTEKARQVFHSMPDNVKNHFLTRYLTFKVSLIDQDHELGCESIEYLSKLSDCSEGRDILYACIREAQQAGDRQCALAALQAIIRSWNGNEVTPSNLPSILRCSIRLIQLIEEDDDTGKVHLQNTVYADDLCYLFEKAAECAEQNPQDGDNKVFTVFELHWFRKNAYNLGVLNEIAIMAMRCHFVVSSALISLARTEDKVDDQLQYYLEARRHIREFDAMLEIKFDTTQYESVIIDLMAKLSTLLVFDFEAATALKNWDSLNEIVRKAKTCQDEVTYKAMGDCILRSRAPAKVMFSTMRLIINEIFELEKFDYEKLMKYIRCMFQVILGTDDISALQLLEQALQIASEANEIGNQLPSAEVEWLVATTFNHGIEYYVRGEADACHRWSLKAMNLANYVDDGGVMRDMLHDKFAQLQFDGRLGRMATAVSR
ncbi:hypothetical protein M441DRAFT_459152 [Trichoderma asperellum CBS 433.97]|uniref:Protein ZIP4 homolog n=1 Tax=Trichoderma asperellum (strain ATCC 204424 / CBS 433.97 / NBRC 101777) TaxID=1042311 RepID=A0A2T3Z5I4_TRIA4|nr:hypothetical protein M441DRAFT_459152 [Trichoderma asperellum CBS 433.97]PTB40057.1 hypothetical protein M441DRAFT_459152 [Trichoderma asperellum CBS 433.97]